MKKITTVGLGLMLAIPLTGFAASGVIDYTVDSAVKEVQKNDLSTAVKAASQPKLSNETAVYQGEFSEELEVIQDKQAEVQDKKAVLQSELTAYNMVYGYWMAEENYELQKKNLALAEKEHAILQKKYEKGVVSQLELLNGEISINNAKAQLEEAEQAFTMAKNQLNQQLGNKDLNQDISIEEDVKGSAFAFLDSKKTKAANFLKDTLPQHVSVMNVMIKQYNEMIDNVDSLTVMGRDTYVDNIKKLEDVISMTEQLMASLPQEEPADTEHPEEEAVKAAIANTESGEEAVETGDEESSEEPAAPQLTQEQQQLIASYESNKEQLQKLKSDYAEARADLAAAKKELKEYYQYQRDQAVIQRQQLQQQIELLAYQYESRFDSLEAKIELYEENVKKYEELYKKNEKLVQNGLMTETELEKVRMGQISSALQLNSAKKDYQLLVKELELFQKGLTAAGGY